MNHPINADNVNYFLIIYLVQIFSCLCHILMEEFKNYFVITKIPFFDIIWRYLTLSDIIGHYLTLFNNILLFKSYLNHNPKKSVFGNGQIQLSNIGHIE